MRSPSARRLEPGGEERLATANRKPSAFALAGGALGLLLGFMAAFALLLAVNTALRLPRVGDGGIAVGMDWRVLAFALGISLLTGLVFGASPAIRAHASIWPRCILAGPSHNTTRKALVASEIALAVILMAGAALLIRTFAALYSVDRGFDAANLITMRMKLIGAKFQKASVVADTMNAGLEGVRVRASASTPQTTYFIPLQTAIGANVDIAGRPVIDKSLSGWAPVAPGYFEVFRILRSAAGASMLVTTVPGRPSPSSARAWPRLTGAMPIRWAIASSSAAAGPSSATNRFVKSSVSRETPATASFMPSLSPPCMCRRRRSPTR